MGKTRGGLSTMDDADMAEPAEIRLDLADVLAELFLGAVAREVERDEDDNETAREIWVTVNAEVRPAAERQ